jgi:hypothetical protein
MHERVDEIDEQTGGHDAAQQIIDEHGSSLETVAGVGVEDRAHEEADTQNEEDDVRHGVSPDLAALVSMAAQ